MAFTAYITYTEYQELGGKLSLDDFTIYVRPAQRMLDYITFNRIQCLTRRPDEVNEVLKEFIDRLSAQDKSGGDTSALSNYSNGVETFGFKSDSEKAFNNSLVKYATQFLPEYLTARSVGFNVGMYLQPEDYNS